MCWNCVHTHRQLAQDHTGSIQWLVEDQLMSMHSYQHQAVHSLLNHTDCSVEKENKTFKKVRINTFCIFFFFLKFLFRQISFSVSVYSYNFFFNFVNALVLFHYIIYMLTHGPLKFVLWFSHVTFKWLTN